MNDTLIVFYDPFTAESTVYTCQNDKQQRMAVSSNIADLAKNISEIANASNIFSVKVNAPSYVLEDIKQQLTTTNYTKQKIEVEGI